MTLAECREQWEKGGEVKLIATRSEPIGAGAVYNTVYVILNFRDEYSLHRYFPMMGMGWQVSVDISNSSLDKCLEAVSDVFETQLPE